MNPTYAEVEASLLNRWPETKLEPSLERITALCGLLADPQDAYRVVQLTGTNGKGSTSRMIDALLRAAGLRTGRFTSPHLESMTERISIDGEPLSQDAFVDAFADVAAYAQIVDDTSAQRGDPPLSFFEMMVAMAYAAFADAPVDIAVVEVGMGGTWDATSVATADVATVLPVGVDHGIYLGNSPDEIAVEKAGIISPGSHAVIAQQIPTVMEVLGERLAAVGAESVVEGVDFGVESRTRAVDGQMLRLAGLGGVFDDVFLPLHGAHQAHNAAVALASAEVMLGGKELDAELVREAFSSVTSPGRLELVRSSPSVLLDAAHNPAGAEALVVAVQEAFEFSPLIGVVGTMIDKDADGILRALEPVLAHIICTQNSTERALAAEELADIATGIFGAQRVTLVSRLDDALENGISMAETHEGHEEAIGSGGVLVTGSVVTAGQARILLGGQQ